MIKNQKSPHWCKNYEHYILDCTQPAPRTAGRAQSLIEFNPLREQQVETLNYDMTLGGFPIEIETQISKLITYSLAIIIT